MVTNPLDTSPWSGYCSEIEDVPRMKTNIATLLIMPVTEWNTIFTPLTIIPYPVTEWNTIFTPLTIIPYPVTEWNTIFTPLTIIPYPVTEWNTIFTALTTIGNISKDANYLTIICSAGGQ